MKNTKLLNVLGVIVIIWAGFMCISTIVTIDKSDNYFTKYYNPASPNAVTGVTDTTYTMIRIGSYFSSFVIAILFVGAPTVLGYLLIRRRKYKFCKILSCVTCIGIPIGTIIGIVIFIILSNETVKAQFAVQ